MRRQTATSGINPAGSSRALRLDPLSLPVSFDAHDIRADGGVRQIELHRERVVLRRALHGMQMAVNVRVSDFLGVALRGIDDAQMLVLVASRSVVDDSAVRKFRPRRDRRGLADVERHLRAAAIAGRQGARAGATAPASQRDPVAASEIPGAAARRRLAQSGESSPGRARDHRQGLISHAKPTVAQSAPDDKLRLPPMRAR